MEQKQLDELDESYFEEFVDEDPLEDVKISPAKEKKAKKPAKKSAKKTSKKDQPADKIEITPVKEAEPVKELEKEKPVVEEPKVVDTAASVDPWESEKVNDPWDDDDDGEGFFKEVSTWKAITGIVVVLLIFSVFTQGFQFTEGTNPTGAATTSITSLEAQNKVLAYVNNNLLQPPFVAEVLNTEDVGGLFKVSLTVAGQNVDSYITKSGDLFFPQGFDTTVDPLTGESTSLENVVESPGEEKKEEPVVEEKPDETVVEEKKEEPVVEEKPTPVPATKTSLSVAAKRWLFQPEVLKVKQGDVVKLTIVPTGLDFTFAIADFGVSKEVKGETTVEFTADKKGSFEVSCASCEDWRGMTGTLLVE